MANDGLPKTCVIVRLEHRTMLAMSTRLIEEGRWQPLLAAELFNIREHPEYAQHILVRYPGAQSLAVLLAPVVSCEMICVEQEIARYTKRRRLLKPRRGVGIGVACNPDVRMAKALLDDLRVYPLSERKGGVGSVVALGGPSP